MKTLEKIILGMGGMVLSTLVLCSSPPKVDQKTVIDHYNGSIQGYKVNITEEFRGSSSKRDVVLEATSDASDLQRISGTESGKYHWDSICVTDSDENTMCHDFSYSHSPGSKSNELRLGEASNILYGAVRDVRNEENKTE